jgi:hypothetical protein
MIIMSLFMNIFLDNKYTKCYFRIIEKSKPRLLEISENHHIIPKSMKGTNISTNFVKLTPREHFICHILLTKMTVGNDKYKMLCAMNLMMQTSSKKHQRDYSRSSRLYESLRNEFILYSKGRPKPEGFGKKVALSNSTRVVSERVKEVLRERNKRGMSAETRQRMSDSGKGRIFSESHKQKISEAHKGKVKSAEHLANIKKSKMRKKIDTIEIF